MRLYSIASSRYGDSFDGNTTTLCVRRATYTDPETGKDDPAKKGICSNFLCDAAPGTEVLMTGEHCRLGGSRGTAAARACHGAAPAGVLLQRTGVVALQKAVSAAGSKADGV